MFPVCTAESRVEGVLVTGFKECLCCGTQFVGLNSSHKFCSMTCQENWTRLPLIKEVFRLTPFEQQERERILKRKKALQVTM